MSASVFAFLAQVKERGAQLPQPLAAALLLAAVRLSEKNNQAVRPDLLVVDEDGGLTLRKGSPDREGPYSAPELASEKVSPRDPRVLVFAAGALGYELSTLETPKPDAATEGLLAPVIQKALAADRKDRYRNLEEMAQAIQELQKRPTNDEERLILTAVVQSTAAPKTVAKVTTRKIQAFYALDPSDAPDVKDDEPLASSPRRVAPVHGWDPQDRTPRVVFPKEPAAPLKEPRAAPSPAAVAPQPPAEPEAQPVSSKAVEPAPAPKPQQQAEAPRDPRMDAALERIGQLATELEADRRSRAEEFALLDSRLDTLARLGDRIETLEKRPAAPQRAGRREVKDMLDDRRFAEAERALRSAPDDDAGLQVLLGQALAGQTDPDGARARAAEAAFRRAAELDAAWAQPKALLGALLVRQGRLVEGLPLLHAALAIDPRSPEALAALGTPNPHRPPFLSVLGIGAGAGAAAALAVILSVKIVGAPPVVARAVAAPPAMAAAPPPSLAEATPVAVALPLPTAPPRAEQPSADSAPAAPAARPEKPSRPRKLVSAESRKRPEALAEAARGEKALRAFDTATAQASFEAALKADASLPAAHRGMGMVYVLQGKDPQAKAEYRRYLELQPDAPDREQIQRLLSR